MAKQHSDGDGILAFLTGLFLGLTGGALLALLYAPKSGKEFRSDLQDAFKEFPDKLGDKIQTSKSQYGHLIDRTKVGLENQVNKIDKALKAGKMAAAKAREEEESGHNYSFN